VLGNSRAESTEGASINTLSSHGQAAGPAHKTRAPDASPRAARARGAGPAAGAVAAAAARGPAAPATSGAPLSPAVRSPPPVQLTAWAAASARARVSVWAVTRPGLVGARAAAACGRPAACRAVAGARVLCGARVGPSPCAAAAGGRPAAGQQPARRPGAAEQHEHGLKAPYRARAPRRVQQHRALCQKNKSKKSWPMCCATAALNNSAHREQLSHDAAAVLRRCSPLRQQKWAFDPTCHSFHPCNQLADNSRPGPRSRPRSRGLGRALRELGGEHAAAAAPASGAERERSSQRAGSGAHCRPPALAPALAPSGGGGGGGGSPGCPRPLPLVLLNSRFPAKSAAAVRAPRAGRGSGREPEQAPAGLALQGTPAAALAPSAAGGGGSGGGSPGCPRPLPLVLLTSRFPAKSAAAPRAPRDGRGEGGAHSSSRHPAGFLPCLGESSPASHLGLRGGSQTASKCWGSLYASFGWTSGCCRSRCSSAAPSSALAARPSGAARRSAALAPHPPSDSAAGAPTHPPWPVAWRSRDAAPASPPCPAPRAAPPAPPPRAACALWQRAGAPGAAAWALAGPSAGWTARVACCPARTTLTDSCARRQTGLSARIEQRCAWPRSTSPLESAHGWQARRGHMRTQA